MTEAITSLLHPCSKCCKDNIPGERVCVAEKQVNFDCICMMAPVSPVLFMSPGSHCHNSSVNCFPHYDDIMCEIIFCGKWHLFQEVPCLNFELKYKRSEGVQFLNVGSDEYLEATSAMTFSSPAIKITRCSANLHIYWYRAST